jgi:hypothetical protein
MLRPDLLIVIFLAAARRPGSDAVLDGLRCWLPRD